MYYKEQQLDQILKWFASRANTACQVSQIPLQISLPEKREIANILQSFGLIKPMRVEFNSGKPVTFPDIYSITPEGVRFANFDSFVALAKRKHKEDRRFDFEYFKIGYDSIMAMLAIIISIVAFFISLKK